MTWLSERLAAMQSHERWRLLPWGVWLLLALGAVFALVRRTGSNRWLLAQLSCSQSRSTGGDKQRGRCGRGRLFVPYVMPGLPLAQEVAARLREWQGRLRSVWLRNHGLIALGETAADALATTLMAAKAARVLLGALSTGKEIPLLQPGEVAALDAWEDEAVRRRLLADSDVGELE